MRSNCSPSPRIAPATRNGPHDSRPPRSPSAIGSVTASAGRLETPRSRPSRSGRGRRPTHSQEAVAYAQRGRGERRRPAFGWDALTPTELDVARHVASGLTNPQVADKLHVGTATVKTHLDHIYAKLGINSRAELAAEVTRRA